jgi:hypothetical protein
VLCTSLSNWRSQLPLPDWQGIASLRLAGGCPCQPAGGELGMKILVAVFLLISLFSFVLMLAACMRSSQISTQEQAGRLFHG